MKKILFALILLIFLASRLYQITTIPGSVYWDEASIGYNAWSVSQDLKDEWGEFLPLHFRAFGEFKLPVFVYTVALFTKVFGLGELAVRLPAVLFTAGSIAALYLLVKKMSRNEKLALLAAFIFSVSPWMFIFSRTGYEATAGLFFYLAFIYFLVNYFEKRIFILPAVVAGLLAFYSYNSFRILVPVSLVLFVLHGLITKQFPLKKMYVEFAALAVLVVGIVPTARLYMLDQGAARLTTVGVNEPVQIAVNYFSHFDFKFLFVEGDVNHRSQQPGWGQLYMIELPLLLLGVWKILRQKSMNNWLFLILLFIAPIPASLAKEAPHALRSVLMAPMFSTFAAFGAWQTANIFKKYKFLVIAGICLAYLFSFKAYYWDFLQNYNQLTGSDWQIEYKQIYSEFTGEQPAGKVQVTDRYAQPYIFGLYYLKFPLEEFRKTVVYNPPDKWGFSTVKSFGNFEFGKYD